MWDRRIRRYPCGQHRARCAGQAYPDLTTAQKEALTGFVQTMEAFDLGHVGRQPRHVRHSDRGRCQSDRWTPRRSRPRRGVPAHHQSARLCEDEPAGGRRRVLLRAPAGFAGFDTPATFLTVNRGLRARADILTKDYATALTDSGASFVSEAAADRRRVRCSTYSEQLGRRDQRTVQPVSCTRNWIIELRAQLQADGKSLDDRVLPKTVTVTPFTLDGITASYNSRCITLTLARANAPQRGADPTAGRGRAGDGRRRWRARRTSTSSGPTSGNLPPIANPYVARDQSADAAR